MRIFPFFSKHSVCYRITPALAVARNPLATHAARTDGLQLRFQFGDALLVRLDGGTGVLTHMPHAVIGRKFCLVGPARMETRERQRRQLNIVFAHLVSPSARRSALMA